MEVGGYIYDPSLSRFLSFFHSPHVFLETHAYTPGTPPPLTPPRIPVVGWILHGINICKVEMGGELLVPVPKVNDHVHVPWKECSLLF